MNCKPGDLAIIIRDPFQGRMVEVCYAAPVDDHILPNGQPNFGSGPGSWVVKSLGSPFVLRAYTAGVPHMQTSQYAVCIDSALRALPGELDEEETNEDRELAI